MNKFATSIIAIFAAASLSACATSGTPNKFAANISDSPAASFCKAEAVKISARMAVSQSQGPALSGRTDTMEIRERVLNDCMSQQRVAGR